MNDDYLSPRRELHAAIQRGIRDNFGKHRSEQLYYYNTISIFIYFIQNNTLYIVRALLCADTILDDCQRESEQLLYIW